MGMETDLKFAEELPKYRLVSKSNVSGMAMDKRASLRLNGPGGFIAIALVVVYGLFHLSGAWAFACGALFLLFAIWMVSNLWHPLPKSFWWYCLLGVCLGGIGLLLLKSSN